MPEAYRITEQSQAHFLTCTVTDWIDLFSRKALAATIVDSLRYCIDHKGLRLHAWCLMTNHIHLIASSKDGIHLSNIVRDFKKFTAKEINRQLRDTSLGESRRQWMLQAFQKAALSNPDNQFIQVWQPGFHPVLLMDRERGEQRLAYLHDNPVRAGYVDLPWEWRYSSARDYMLGKPGLLPVELL